MKEYFFSLFLAATLIALVGILSPGKAAGGIARHLRLLSSLFLLCILISPLTNALDGIFAWLQNGGAPPLLEDSPQTDYGELASDALDEASRAYFAQMLTLTLSEKFAVSPEELHCTVEWEITDGESSPSHVTLLLSGKAIWRDPTPLKNTVQALLGCPCDVVIDSIYTGGKN